MGLGGWDINLTLRTSPTLPLTGHSPLALEASFLHRSDVVLAKSMVDEGLVVVAEDDCCSLC